MRSENPELPVYPISRSTPTLVLQPRSERLRHHSCRQTKAGIRIQRLGRNRKDILAGSGRRSASSSAKPPRQDSQVRSYAKSEMQITARTSMKTVSRPEPPSTGRSSRSKPCANGVARKRTGVSARPSETARRTIQYNSTSGVTMARSGWSPATRMTTTIRPET